LRLLFGDRKHFFNPQNTEFLRILNVCKYLNLDPETVKAMDYDFFLRLEIYIEEEINHRKRQQVKDKLKNKRR